MRWIVLAIVVALVAFGISAFVSRENTCRHGRGWGASECKVTYWWDIGKE
jgi:hypothetical protein